MKISSTLQRIGENIRQQRTLQKMKGETMAKALGISKSALSQMENGKTNITISRLFEIAELLNVDLIVLMPERLLIRNEFLAA